MHQVNDFLLTIFSYVVWYKVFILWIFQIRAFIFLLYLYIEFVFIFKKIYIFMYLSKVFYMYLYCKVYINIIQLSKQFYISTINI
jgi:hypothetical protein